MTPVCATCGAVFSAAESPPDRCPICEDERRWVPTDGQRWPSLEELTRDHRNGLREEEPGLLGIGLEPEFAIGQRALLVETPAGNVLWDMVPICTEATVAGSGVAVVQPRSRSRTRTTTPGCSSGVAGADGRGALLSGDIVQVLPHGRPVTFMWSYPNVPPLPAREVERIAGALEPWTFDRIWGA